MNNEVGDDGWWRDVDKTKNVLKNMINHSNHSNNETQEREKEWGGQNFGEFTIDC
jgi:hypothetical protein